MSTDTLPYVGWRPMGAIRRAYYERNPHGHWFDADTMRFFKTRLPRHGLQWADGTLTFVTSEKGPDEVRRWSVRILKPDGTLGDDAKGFQGYATRESAVRAMVKLARCAP